MARWENINNRGNIEDRRSFAPVVGSVSIVGVIALMAITFLGGGDVVDALRTLESVPMQTQGTNITEFAGEDAYEIFASTVLGSNNAMWERVLKETGKEYTPPKLVLFRTATDSLCGGANSQVGPHYCPMDETIYLDETFFEELTNKLGATGGDVAEAYVISHEVGHHVQHQFGIIGNISTNEESIALELQADCFAGMWANYIKDLEVLSPGEIGEAMDAAESVGDDRIQATTTGRITPENWTHGSSEQRVAAFNKGYETGSLESCNNLFL